jgi:hypothetical protein
MSVNTSNLWRHVSSDGQRAAREQINGLEHLPG